jgi:hypothetical protein
MTVLRQRFDELGVPNAFHLEPEPRGHKVVLDPQILGALQTYVRTRLDSRASATHP